MTNENERIKKLKDSLSYAAIIPTDPEQIDDEFKAMRVRATIALTALIEFARPHVDADQLDPAEELLNALIEVAFGHKPEWLLTNATFDEKDKPNGTMGFYEANFKSLIAAGIMIAARENIGPTEAARQLSTCQSHMTHTQILDLHKNLTRKKNPTKGITKILFDGRVNANDIDFEQVKTELQNYRFVKTRKLRK
jgi:hypothetical protein